MYYIWQHGNMALKFLAVKILAENGAHDIIQLLGVILTVRSINYEMLHSSQRLHESLIEPICQLSNEKVTSLEVDLLVKIPWCVVLVWFTPFTQVSGLSLVSWQHWLADPMLLSKLYSGFVELIKVLIIPVALEKRLQHGH